MSGASGPAQRPADNGLFVVGRFRSGTTAIWNILRHVPGVRAYYEPCHDGLLEHLRLNTSPDPSHVRVSDYWREYASLLESLPRYYRKEFGTERLCLASTAEHAQLREYLGFLLSSGATGEVACLKLNRMDLRLPWLRNNFPGTPIVYIYRDPRDQWVSLFRNQPGGAIDDPYLNTGYDLLIWSASLFPYVPRLGSSAISSSYERHYLIWRISLELGKLHADCVINFEQDIQDDPDRGLVKLLHILGRDEGLRTGLREFVAPSRRNTWQAYHDADWFSEIEQRCDSYLEEAGVLRQISENTIFSGPSSEVPVDLGDLVVGLVFPLCRAISQSRGVALENTGLLTSSLQHAHRYSGELASELQKVARDSQKELLHRERELENRSEAYRHLVAALDRVSRDAADEIARRDQLIKEKDCFISALQQELEKTVRDARTEIEARDRAAAEKDAYAMSLQAEIEKLRR